MTNLSINPSVTFSALLLIATNMILHMLAQSICTVARAYKCYDFCYTASN